MGCSDQGGLPGRRGLRVRDIYQAEKRFPQVHIPKLRYGCQPGRCASVVRGETAPRMLSLRCSKAGTVAKAHRA